MSFRHLPAVGQHCTRRLELFGVRANARTGAKALKEQLLQLIQDQAPGRVVVVDGAPAHAPAEAAAIAPGAKPSAVTEGLLARLAASHSSRSRKRLVLCGSA